MIPRSVSHCLACSILLAGHFVVSGVRRDYVRATALMDGWGRGQYHVNHTNDTNHTHAGNSSQQASLQNLSQWVPSEEDPPTEEKPEEDKKQEFATWTTTLGNRGWVGILAVATDIDGFNLSTIWSDGKLDTTSIGVAPWWPLALGSITVFGCLAAVVIFGDSVDRTTETPTLTPQPRSRDPYLDHLKFVLICLAVLVHGWCLMGWIGKSVEACVGWGNTFVMQSFAFISGHQSRNYAEIQDGRLTTTVHHSRLRTNIIATVTITVMMSMLCCTIQMLIVGVFRQANPIGIGLGVLESAAEIYYSAGVLWYIEALCLWRLVQPIWQSLSYPVASAFLVTFIVVLSGKQVGTFPERTIGHFPFFVMGLYTDSSTLINWCSNRPAQIAGTIAHAALLILGLFHWYDSVFDVADFQHPPGAFKPPNKDVGTFHQVPSKPVNLTFAVDIASLKLTCGFYVLSVVAMGGFLAAVYPVLGGSLGSAFDNMSRRSVYAYLGHIPFYLIVLIWVPWRKYMISLPGGLQCLSLATFSLAIVMFFTCWPVHIVLSSICEPNLARLFKSPA